MKILDHYHTFKKRDRNTETQKQREKIEMNCRHKRGTLTSLCTKMKTGFRALLLA